MKSAPRFPHPLLLKFFLGSTVDYADEFRRIYPRHPRHPRFLEFSWRRDFILDPIRRKTTNKLGLPSQIESLTIAIKLITLNWHFFVSRSAELTAEAFVSFVDEFFFESVS